MSCPLPMPLVSRPPLHRWKVLAAGVAANAAFSVAFSGLPMTAVLLRQAYQLDNALLGLMLGLMGLGIALSELPWGLLTDRLGDRPVLLTGLGSTALALLALALWAAPGAPLWVLGAGLLGVGLLGGSVNGASGRAVMGWFPATERGLAMSIRQTAVPLGGGVGALLLPWLAWQGGFACLFGVLAGLCGAAALLCAAWVHEPGHRARRRPGGPRPTRPARPPGVAPGRGHRPAVRAAVRRDLVRHRLPARLRRPQPAGLHRGHGPGAGGRHGLAGVERPLDRSARQPPGLPARLRRRGDRGVPGTGGAECPAIGLAERWRGVVTPRAPSAAGRMAGAGRPGGVGLARRGLCRTGHPGRGAAIRHGAGPGQHLGVCGVLCHPQPAARSAAMAGLACGVAGRQCLRGPGRPLAAAARGGLQKSLSEKLVNTSLSSCSHWWRCASVTKLASKLLRASV